MKDTFTYTARSIEHPDKLATFTLHNGNVSVQLGNAILEQVEEAFTAHDAEEAPQLRAWLKPAATGAMQKISEPVSVQDFDAQFDDESFQATAWIRAGGLRLAPVRVIWDKVDNPEGAEAFVDEVTKRKQQAVEEGESHGGLFSYWMTWVLLGVLVLTLPVIFLRFRRKTA